MYRKIDNHILYFSDDRKSIINMCEKHKMNFTDTLYITYKYYTENLKNCECWVNEGAFDLTIMDLNLKSRKEDVCSDAKFIISSQFFTCDPESDSYGSKFEMFQDHMSVGAYISLVPNNILPEMVLIQLIPKGSLILILFDKACFTILKRLKYNVSVMEKAH